VCFALRVLRREGTLLGNHERSSPPSANVTRAVSRVHAASTSIVRQRHRHVEADLDERQLLRSGIQAL
jgi:hypothetical protein